MSDERTSSGPNVLAARLADGGAEQARASDDGLREELAATRARLQAIIEQLEAGNEELRAANEEIVSSNEELQCANEELQTAKEELLSANEELQSANDEIVARNVETQRINDDLANVLSSMGIAIVLLGRDSRVRRFTPEAGRLLNLIATDVGRPLSDIRSTLVVPDLAATIGDVLEHLVPREQTVTDTAGRWYQLAVRPYLTAGHRIDGTVVSVVDIDTIRSAQVLLTEARDYAECIVNTIREPLVVLDEARHVRSANPAFCSAFQISPDTVRGMSLGQLGDPLWMTPTLQAALARLARGDTIENERIELVSPTLGERTMVLSGRPMARGPDRPQWCLLAFDDVTEEMKASTLARRSEKAMRDMLGAASESIVIAGEDGVITFANAMAARTFGYAPEELVGLGVETLVPEAVRAAHVAHRAAFHGTSGRQEMSPDDERWGRRKDGSLFPVEVTLSAMEGERGPLGVAFVSDITERRLTEARIRAYERKLQETAFEAAAAEERQRRRIAAGFHDNIGQALALAQIRLNAAHAGVAPSAHPDLDEALRLIGQAITDTRSLTFELSPPVLYDLGLPAAVGWLGDQLETQHAMRVSVESDDPLATLDDDTAAVLFRSVRELLTNVVKHADTPTASVEMRRNHNELSVVVEDHGTGFDPGRLRAYESTSGFGLFSVGEQIRRLGGSIDVASRPGQGTRVTLRVLVAARTSDAPPRGPA